ncbi:MAG: secretin N-terminal domain-containing protein [Candidatus Babeliales bacterium]|jgi:general secretion pathway protein D
MKNIKIVFLSITLMGTHCLHPGFFLPGDKSTADTTPKPSRNNIFSSVKNSPESTSKLNKPATPVMDFSMPDPAPVATAKVTRDVSPEPAFKKVLEEKIDKPAEVAKQAPIKKIDDASIKKLIEEKIEHKESGVLYQNKYDVEDGATIAFNFEEASLANLVSYIESVHNIKFIHDEIITPAAKDAKGYSGHKITFRTNKNLTRKESWDLFLTFLHIAGLDVVPLVQDGFYKIVPLARVNSETIPTFIGVDVNILPDTDMIVRFVYFAKNIEPKNIIPVLRPMQGGSAKLDTFAGLKALIFTDRACAIKSLMQIVTELDRSVLPEVLSVVKLKRTTASDVKTLYNSLTKPAASAGPQPAQVWTPGKKETFLEYFPQGVVLVADDRTNSLILLGSAKEVKRVEDFVVNHVDIALDRGVPPIFTYRLQYTVATDVAALLNKVVLYGSGTMAGKYGGVLDGVKYFQKMTIAADTHSNSLIINATPEDFEALRPLIEELDVAQKQIGLEVLIVQVKDIDTKTLGAQISGPNGAGTLAAGASKLGPTFMQNVTAQTSGVPTGTPIVTTVGNPPITEDFSIKSSLALLLGSPVLNEAGSILVTFGRPIWAIFKVLKTLVSSHIVANPFVVVSNNTLAEIKSGEERRQVSGRVVSTGSLTTTGFTNIEATLDVQIKPQINKGNIINLQIMVRNSRFTQAANPADSGGDLSPRDEKTVQTTASVANGETLVLGGIMTETYSSASNGVPFLENIPVFGWFFKSKTRTITRDHFLIFISPRIIDPTNDSTDIDDYTDYKLREAQKNIDLIDETDWFTNKKDPIQRAFFGTDGSRVLQELRTGDTFEKRREIDGRINQPLNAPEQQKSSKKKRSEKNQKKKSKKQQREQESGISFDIEQSQPENISSTMKNSIQGSMQQGKGR